MVDISTYQTQQAAVRGKGVENGKAQTGASTGVFAGTPGMSFMDLIFARVTADGNSGKAASALLKAGNGKGEQAITDSGIIDHGEPLTQEQLLQALRDAGLAVEEVPPNEAEATADTTMKTTAEDALAALATGETALETTDGTTGETNTPTAVKAPVDMAAARKKLVAWLENLVAGLPQENKPVVLDLSPGELKQMIGKLQFSTGEDETGPALIATGLTPEKLAQMLQDLTDGNEQGEALVIGMVKILPVEAKKDAIFLPRGIVVVQPQTSAGDVNTPQTPTNELAAKLNALVTGDAGAGEALPEESKFDQIMRVLQEAQGNGKKTGQPEGSGKGIENAIKKVTEHVGAGLSTVPGTPPALTEVFTNFAMDGVFPEGMDFSYTSQPGQSANMPVTGTAQLASLVSHAHQAGQPHPATQMVAATIAKATTNGESKNISIRLDPPELGRVAIRMEFHKDNTVKAVLMAEKPETFMMLQRDAHVLERALQDAGLDIDSGSLSFELSQDGNLFQHDQQSGHGGSGGSGGAEGNADEAGTEIAIETTMDWYADPDTGVMRYSTLV